MVAFQELERAPREGQISTPFTGADGKPQNVQIFRQQFHQFFQMWNRIGELAGAVKGHDQAEP